MTPWRKSSYSGNHENDNCVEVAFSTAVVVRDSKRVQGPGLGFPHDAWRRFLSSVHR
jgi:hypothetical protein